jgi:hypothetical protein
MDLLPKYVLADVLRRLPPHSLASSRSMCQELWAIVDARCDPRTDLLPTTLGGIFVRILEQEDPEFLVWPSVQRRIAVGLEYYAGLKYAQCVYIVPDLHGLFS